MYYREAEWMFGTHEGRLKLAENVGFARLIVIHLVRGQKYESFEKIQDELNGELGAFSPSENGANVSNLPLALSS